MYKEYTVKVHECGSEEWYLNGERHREHGPAINFVDGGTYWFIDGKQHRTDGPAVETNGVRYWFINGKLHRVDGPAVEGNTDSRWFTDGAELTEEEHGALYEDLYK